MSKKGIFHSELSFDCVFFTNYFVSHFFCCKYIFVLWIEFFCLRSDWKWGCIFLGKIGKTWTCREWQKTVERLLNKFFQNSQASLFFLSFSTLGKVLVNLIYVFFSEITSLTYTSIILYYKFYNKEIEMIGMF